MGKPNQVGQIGALSAKIMPGFFKNPKCCFQLRNLEGSEGATPAKLFLMSGHPGGSRLLLFEVYLLDTGMGFSREPTRHVNIDLHSQPTEPAL